MIESGFVVFWCRGVARCAVPVVVSLSVAAGFVAVAPASVGGSSGVGPRPVARSIALYMKRAGRVFAPVEAPYRAGRVGSDRLAAVSAADSAAGIQIDPDEPNAGLVLAGDLNQDGFRDVLDERWEDGRHGAGVTTVTARDGETGRSLWQRRVDYPASDTVFVAAMRVGPAGRPGVLVMHDYDHGTGAWETSGVVLTAWDGRTGRQVWSRRIGGTFNSDGAGLVTATVVAIAHLLPGDARDILVSLQKDRGSHSTMRPLVVSGVSGRLVRLPVVRSAGGPTAEPSLFAVPDLNGDGLADVVVDRPRPEPLVQAETAFNGKRIWWRHGQIARSLVAVTPVGRLGPSRTPELALTTNSGNRRGSPKPTQWLLDGPTGQTVWKRSADYVEPVHRAGPRLTPAVDLVDQFDPDGKTGTHRVGVVIRAVAISGRRIYTSRQLLREHSKRGYFGADISVNIAGDIQPDGAKELDVSILSLGNSRVISGLIDGRTGHLRRRDLLSTPAAGSFSTSRGTDLIREKYRHCSSPLRCRQLVIQGRDGLTGRRLFSHSIRLTAPIVVTYGVRVTHNCSDVALSSEGFPGNQLDGIISGTGQPLWILRYPPQKRFGGAITRPTQPAESTCLKTP